MRSQRRDVVSPSTRTIARTTPERSAIASSRYQASVYWSSLTPTLVYTRQSCRGEPRQTIKTAHPCRRSQRSSSGRRDTRSALPILRPRWDSSPKNISTRSHSSENGPIQIRRGRTCGAPVSRDQSQSPSSLLARSSAALLSRTGRSRGVEAAQQAAAADTALPGVVERGTFVQHHRRVGWHRRRSAAQLSADPLAGQN